MDEKPVTETADGAERWVSARTIQRATDVSVRTVKRWAKIHGWRRVNFNSRMIRYNALDVESSLGVEL